MRKKNNTKGKLSTGSVLVVVAHPDDETIGLGGSIARHVDEGRDVFALALTDGVGARGVTNTHQRDVQKRTQAARLAAKHLGFSWLSAETFPDNALDTIPLIDVVRVIERIKDQIEPTLVYTHFPHDLNVDHRIVCQAVMTAFRPQPGESCLEIRACEVASSTDYGAVITPAPFTPSVFVDIKTTWLKKLRALKAYEIEMRPYPHSRSYEGLEALARLRGVSVGLEMAEGFQLLRRLEP